MSAAYPSLAAPPVHQALAGYSAMPPAASSAPVNDTTPKSTVPSSTRLRCTCGAEVSAQHKFCGKCGARLSVVQAAPVQPSVAQAAPMPDQPSVLQQSPSTWQPAHGTPPRATVPAVTTRPSTQSAGPVTVPAMQNRAPISVAARPSGLTGGLIGAVAGQALLPIPVVGLLVGAMVGRNLQRNQAKNNRTIYIKPEPGSANPVPVKLWKLGETSPLTDAGLRLVLEARNVDEMVIYLKRLISSRGGRVQNNSRVVTYAAHMVASMSLDCTVNGVLAELSQSQ